MDQSTPAPDARVSVIIATRNRRDELHETCTRLMTLTPPPDEVLVCADGCTDDTVAMLAREFPHVVVLENAESRGSVASRDLLIRSAGAEIVVSLDDDSWPVHTDLCERIVRLFASRPDAAVIAFPELRDEGEFASRSKTDRTPGHRVSAYANCAAAMRRSTYLSLPGFPGFFTHMYEEPDYALQCYGAGLSVWFEPTLTTRHRRSPRNRSAVVIHHQHARNEIWSVWMRCPWPLLPIVSAFRALRQFQHASSVSWRWAAQEPLWWWQAVRGAVECARHRAPVPWRVYYRWMRLARQTPPDVAVSFATLQSESPS